MSQVYYVTTFRQLRLSERIRGHFSLLPGVNITNDPDVRARLITPEFAAIAGMIETRHLDEADHLVYGEFDKADLAYTAPEAFLGAYYHRFMGCFEMRGLSKIT